jgi:poly-beta-1,6-N-acetyl-D-glucosamine synthase
MVFHPEWLFYILPTVLILMYWRFAHIHHRAIEPVAPSSWESDLRSTSVLVVIPFCNELHQLPLLLHDLQQLDIEKMNVQFVLVNDHSTDGGDIYAAEHLPTNRAFHLIHNSEIPGKKQAIETALKKYPSDVFCTLDADARVPKSWLREMVNTYKVTDTAITVGQVKMEYSETFLGRFQYTEWLLLQGLTIASITRNKAILCNGASLLVECKSFEQIGGYTWHKHIPSGDDQYTMLALKRLDEHVIAIQTRPESAVTIQSAPTYSTFIKQRLRWASKKQLGWDSDVVRAGLIIGGANIALLLCAICSPFIPYTSHLYFMLLGLKCIADYKTARLVANQRDQVVHELDLIILNLIYPWYMLLIFIVGKVYRPKWKHTPKPIAH